MFKQSEESNIKSSKRLFSTLGKLESLSRSDFILGALSYHYNKGSGTQDGSIDTAHLAADAVTNAKIADDALDSEHYTDGSIFSLMQMALEHSVSTDFFMREECLI